MAGLFRQIKRSLLSTFCLFALAGCSSTDMKQAAGGAATVSALVVALPLVPVAEGYHFLSGDIRELKAKVAALKVKLDPVYEERLRLIEIRDPVEDARTVVSEGCDLLLPTIPDGIVFPGFFDPHIEVLAPTVPNPKISIKSSTYLFLEQLMDKDKLHLKSEQQGVSYSGKAYSAFLRAGWRYKERFNREVVRLTGRKL